jgi:23S rRNA (guanosine2251-2'-O)-methyltransferase
MNDRYVIGRRAVMEALAAGAQLEKIHVSYGAADEGAIASLRAAAQRQDVPVSTMDRRKFQTLCKELGVDTSTAQGVIALRMSRSALTFDEWLASRGTEVTPTLIVVLDGITDPHNLGAIARSAEGAGASALLMPTKFSAPITPVAIKASAGALEHLPVIKVTRVSETLKALRTHGFRIVGTGFPGTHAYNDSVYDGDLAIVIGSEDEGLHPSVRAVCDAVVEIPMRGKVASLNASVAAGIVLFEAQRQRPLLH